MRNFLLFFLFLNTALFSQKYTKEEHQALNDSVKLIRGMQPLKAINMLFEISDNQKDYPTPQLTNTYNLIAEILFKQGLFSESLSYFKLSLDCFTLTRKNFTSTNVTYPPWILINIGNVYFHNKNFEKAYEYYQMAKENFQETNEHNKLYGLPTAYDNIGKVFFEKGENDSALLYFQKSLKIREENKLKGAMIYSYNNLLSLVPPENEPLALKYVKIVDGLYNQISFLPNQPDGQINIETNYGIFNYKLGLFYYDLNEFEKSINYLIKSTQFLSNSFNDKINSELLMAKCKIALKNYKQAETI
ncbi:MAG: tetratricopeptide repeat protein, partial [Bacteroidota bacterium]|nr:tetratricopeptide repeat protein [Bacteroidota bacterium]